MAEMWPSVSARLTLNVVSEGALKLGPFALGCAKTRFSTFPGHPLTCTHTDLSPTVHGYLLYWTCGVFGALFFFKFVPLPFAD